MARINQQNQRAITELHKLKTRMSGILSASALAEMSGGKIDPDVEKPDQVFSPSAIINTTRELMTDPDIVQGSAAARALMRTPEDRVHNWLPDEPVGTQKHLDFIRELVARLTDEVPMSESIDSIVDSRAVPSPWTTLYTLPGHPMSPMGYPIATNKKGKLRDVRFTERHIAILEKLIELMFGEKWTPKSGYEIAVKSSSGLPAMIYDVEGKMQMYRDLADNFPQIMDAIRRGKAREMAQRYGVLLCYYVNRRNQNDAVRDENGPKDRSSPSVGQAAGFEPGILFAGRRIEGIEGFFRTRSRPVYAGNGPVNYFLSSLLQPVRDHYLETYKFTWKHTGLENLEYKLRGWIPIGVDASQFDQNFPDEAAAIIFNKFREYFTDDVVDLMEYMWRCPVYCPSPVKDRPDQGFWFGNPFDIDDFKASRGLPSGIAYNPDFGKIWGTAYLLMMLDDLYGDVLEFGINGILRGEHPAYGLLNQGDDAIILSKSTEISQGILARLESGEASPYIDLEVERHLTFLGMVVTQNGSEYKAYPNITSMLTNFVCAEHPVGSPMDRYGHRKHWALGVESWKSVYGICPEYEKVLYIFNTTLVKYYGNTIDKIAAPWARMSRDVLGVAQLSEEEARFLEKPERRFYSVNMDLVRKEIKDDVIRTVSPDEIYQRGIHYIQPQYQ